MKITLVDADTYKVGGFASAVVVDEDATLVLAGAGSGTGPSEDGASCAVMADSVLTCSGIDGAGARGVLMVACRCSFAS